MTYCRETRDKKNAVRVRVNIVYFEHLLLLQLFLSYFIMPMPVYSVAIIQL
jgi:hypothetical protein